MLSHESYVFIRFVVAVPSNLERTSPNPSVQRSRASIVNSATPTFNLSPLQRRNDAEASAIWQCSGHCMGQSGTVSGMSGRGPNGTGLSYFQAGVLH